jgi:hypothetical protein
MRMLPRAYFINRLVEQFEIMWLRNVIVWLCQLKILAVQRLPPCIQANAK